MDRWFQRVDRHLQSGHDHLEHLCQRLLVVLRETGRFAGNLLEDVVDEAVDFVDVCYPRQEGYHQV